MREQINEKYIFTYTPNWNKFYKEFYPKRLPRKLKLKLYGRRRDRKPGLTYIKNMGIKFTQS